MSAVATDEWNDLAPGEGRWWDCDEDGYHGSPLVSRSSLDDLEKSAAMYHARWIARTRSDEPTDAMLFGRLVHVLTLEPDRFAAQWVVTPKWEHHHASKLGKAEREEWHIANAHKVEVSFDDHRRAKAIAAAVLAHPYARKLIEQSQAEKACVWRDAHSSTLMRARFDLWHPAHVVADLKTCDDPSEHGFANSMAKFSYYRQAALYLDAAKAVTGEDHKFLIIAVRSKPEHEVAVWPIDPLALAQGRDEYRALLSELARRSIENDWRPPYSIGIQKPLSLPRWAQDRV